MPIALVLLPTTADVRTPEASGVTIDGKPFYDVGAKAKIVELKPRAAVTLGVKFIYASTVRFTYTTQVLGVVQAPNRNPEADAGVDQTVTVGTNVQLSGAGSKDPDNDPLTYVWQLVLKPASSTATLTNANTVSPSFTADVPGTYTVTLTVSDGKKGEDTDSVEITATRGNRAPTITSRPVTTATIDQPYTYDVNAIDPDAGDVLTYSLPVAPTGMTINSSTGLIQWTPTAAQVGSQNITVRVQDQGGLFAEQNFTVAVTAPPTNRPPIITSTSVTTGIVGQVYSYDVEATDPDAGDVLTFSLPAKPDGMTIDPATGLIQWTPTTAQVGDQNVIVHVQDQGGLFAEQSFTITVGSLPGNPPVITSTPNISRWEQLNPPGTPPTPRAYTGAMPYDEINDRLILFGGTDKEYGLPHLQEVWILENATGAAGTPRWTRLNPTGTGPVGRSVFAAAYDPTSNRLLIHGGQNNGGALADTWVLTNANGLGGTSEWIQLPSGNPRVQPGSAYDLINNRLIVFAGTDCCTGTDKNDVRVLIDANGIGDPQWITLSPQGTPPSNREALQTAYDATNNRLIVFGGHNTFDETFNDVWVLSNANGLGGTPTWTQLAPTGSLPQPRGAHSAFYDANSNQLIVFGGLTVGQKLALPRRDYTFLNEVWVLTHANGQGGTPKWVQLAPGGTKPIGRAFTSTGYARATNRMVLTFGSNDFQGPQYFNDVWLLSNASGQCTAGQPCNYDVDATDPDVGDTLTFSLDAAPTGMTINPSTGLIEWTPTPTQIGDHAVTVRVRDASGLSATQTFTLTVAPVAVPNVVGLAPEWAEALIGAADLTVGTETHVGGEIKLNFDTLPSAQGWKFFEGSLVPEDRVFKVANGALSLDTLGLGSEEAHYRIGPVDARLPYRLFARARVLAQDGPGLSVGFDVFALNELAQFLLTPTAVLQRNKAPIALDNTIFHDFLLTGKPGSVYQLAVDGLTLVTDGALIRGT